MGHVCFFALFADLTKAVVESLGATRLRGLLIRHVLYNSPGARNRFFGWQSPSSGGVGKFKGCSVGPPVKPLEPDGLDARAMKYWAKCGTTSRLPLDELVAFADELYGECKIEKFTSHYKMSKR